MKNILLVVILFIAISCSNSNVNVTGADKYIETITGFTCEKAAVTNSGHLIIAIDAIKDVNYNELASQFMEEAKREGVTGLKGVFIVDIKDCKFQQGSVIGKRIGKAYN